MFTGIIQAKTKVVKFEGDRLWIRLPFQKIKSGESICIEGVCLTVAVRQRKLYGFDVGPETRRITTLGHLHAGQVVNLERALRVGDLLGGHWVTGHVEGLGKILRIEPEGRNHWVDVRLPPKTSAFVLNKGSITVDGISLTVASKKKDHIRLMIIPHTWEETTLRYKKLGDPVNIETDLLAKYAVQSLGKKL